MKEIFLTALGKRIRELREEQSMSMAELGRRVKKDYHSILRLEKGDIDASLIYLIQIAKGLGTDISTLTKGLP